MFKTQTSYRTAKGMRWAVMQRFDIPSAADGKTYLTRWRLIQTPLCAIYLHKIMRPDAVRELHDHPWDFIPIILKGGYYEMLEDRRLVGEYRAAYGHSRLPFRPRYMRATNLHRITKLYRNPTWTLCLVGRRKRQWGFQTKDGWVDWPTFFGISDAT